jgi:hypothetical protein
MVAFAIDTCIHFVGNVISFRTNVPAGTVHLYNFLSMKVLSFLRFLYEKWMIICRAIGTVMGAILLTIIWIILFGPYALLFFVIKKRSNNFSTYWHPLLLKSGEGLEHPY